MTKQQQNADDTGTDDTGVDEGELDIDEQDQDGDETEAVEAEWTPPTREQWEANQAKLKRANEQAKKLREAKRAAAVGAGTEGAATDPAELSKWQARAVRAAAKVQLIARGADADMVDLALARLKPAEVEFDGDDEPDLVDWIDDMEDRYPKLFKQPDAAPPAQRPKAGKVETPTGRPVRPKMTLGEQILANSLGTSRRRG